MWLPHEGHIAALALLVHLEEDVGLPDPSLRRENRPLALKNAPVPVDFLVSTDDFLRVQTSAKVDLQWISLLLDYHTPRLTYVNSDVWF